MNPLKRLPRKRMPARRLTAAFLALLLYCSAPAAAWAEDAPPADPVNSESAEEPALSPEPAPSPEPSLTPAPTLIPEPTGGDSAPVNSEAEEKNASSSLLTIGGHSTYMNGAPGGLFLPDKVMTRSEAAQMLYNLLASPPTVSSSRFPDVPLNAWYGKAVNALAQVKVLSGYTDGTFGPGDTMTRAQFVTALCRCFTLPDGNQSFTDVSKNHWAAKYISAAATQGWIKGPGDGTFRPDKAITRAEAVTVMNAALQRTGDGFAADRGTQKFKDVSKNHWAYLQITEAAKPVDPVTPPPTTTPTPAPGSFTVGQTVRVTASGLNLRAQPNTSAQIVTVIANGEILTITGIPGLPWLEVKTSSGKTGYVHSGPSDDPYVVAYTPGQISGITLSNSYLSMHQYQSARLDCSISSGNLKDVNWSSSDPSVAVVGYKLSYGFSKTQGLILYAKKPGTATLTFSDASGQNKATCKVTVTGAESVRFAYASENSAVAGKNFDLVAVTEPTRTAVTFTIVKGPASGAYPINSYVTENRNSQYGLPTNTVRVFKRTVSFNAAGTYTVRATANGSTVGKDFEVFVKPSTETITTTSYGERRCSTEGLKIIANFEGGVPEVEDDRIASGNPTVGYGTVIQKGEAFYNNMTATELFAFLIQTTNYGGYTSAVNKFRQNNNLKMSQAQFDALVSFTFNCGDRLNSGGYDMPKTILNAVVTPAISDSRTYPGTVNATDTGGSSATLFAEASKDSKSAGSVGKGTRVTVVGCMTIAAKKQIWYKVSAGGAVGWLPAGFVQLDASGLVHDLAYADAIGVSNNVMQWHRSNGKCYDGLLARRMAECKIFFYGDYAQAYHSNANYFKNTYGFLFPSCERSQEITGIM